MNDTLTIIPAKLGSTRLPKKNIRLLMGKPLMNYSIEAALTSGVCGEIMVSTESDEVAQIAEAAGAKVPFLRPHHLGKDPYGVVDVCMHVLDEYAKKSCFFKKLFILLPTSPLRNAEDIIAADRIFNKQNASFLMSVSEFDHNPFGALQIKDTDNDIMSSCFSDFIGKKRHELPKTFRANGAICILNVTAFREAGTYYGNPLHSYIMPWQRSVDIDTDIDLKFAEFLIREGLADEPVIQ